MKKLFYSLIFSLILCKNSFAEYTISLNKVKNENTSNDKLESNSDSTLLNEILANKKTKGSKEGGQISIGGSFHFFLSNTNEKQIYESDDIQNMMQNEGILNIVHKNDINDYISYSISSQIKKKFSDKLRIRNVFEVENKNLGKIQLSNYRKIQDDMFVNTYWVKAGSDGAWDSNLNLLLNENNIPNDHITNGVLTGYDTALAYGADTDSATIAYYTPSSNPLVLGISYTPRTYYNEVKNPLFNYKDIFTGALFYSKDINDDLNVKLSTLGEIGSPAANTSQDPIEKERKITGLQAIHFGGAIKYSTLSLAGSFGFFGDSGHDAKLSLIEGDSQIFGKSQDSYYYDVAAGYDINEKTKVSLSYFHSKYSQDYKGQDYTTENGNIITGQATLDNMSLAMDYKLYGDALTPYLEINKFTIKDNDAIPEEQQRESNDGWVIILGAKSKF